MTQAQPPTRASLQLIQNELDIVTLENEAFPQGGPQLEASRAWGLKRRIEYMMGRIVARRALNLAGGPGATAPLSSLADRRCQWPEGWTGSIAHSWDQARCLAVARVARANGASKAAPGIDVESWSKLHASRTDVLGRVLLDEEKALIKDGAFQEWARQRNRAPELALLGWAFSAKEAFYKALYDQTLRFVGFEGGRLLNPRMEGSVLVAELETTQAWSGSVPAGFRLTARTFDEEGRWVLTEID